MLHAPGSVTHVWRVCAPRGPAQECRMHFTVYAEMPRALEGVSQECHMQQVVLSTVHKKTRGVIQKFRGAPRVIQNAARNVVTVQKNAARTTK
jgi:hypothetical protein